MSRAAQVVFSAVFLLFPVFCLAAPGSLEKETKSFEVAASTTSAAVAEKMEDSVLANTLLSVKVTEGSAVLVANGDIQNFKYFELPDPARLVLDIAGVVPEFEKRSFSADAGFKKVRVGPGLDKTRVVFDASGIAVPAYAVRQKGATIEVAWGAGMTAGEAMVAAGTLGGKASESVATTQNPTDLNSLRKFLETEREKLAQQQKKFAEEEAKYLASRQNLKRSMTAQQRRIEEMQTKLGVVTAGEAQPKKTAVSETAGPKTTVSQEETASQVKVASQKAVSPPATTVGRPPKKEREQAYKEIEAIFERQGVLTPRGKFILEPSLQYSYVSSTRVALIGYTVIPAITIGLIDVRSVNRNTFVGALAGRYGLTNRSEVELKIPYVYRDDSTTAQSINVDPPVTDVFNADGNDIGDIEFGFRYQFNMPKDDGPIFIGGLRIKSNTGKDPFEVPIDPATNLALELPTGSGFWGIQPNLTAIIPSDPAVFFGGVSYLYNFDRNISGFGEIDPGDTIGFNFGVGYGINQKASFSLGYEHSIVLKTKQDGETLADAQTTHVGSLLLGGSYRLSDNTNLNLSLSGGLTEAAPDVQLTLRVPVTF